MTKSALSEQIRDLRAVYSESESAKRILDDFASRTNNQRVTKVDQVLSRLKDTDIPRAAVIQLFRKLDHLDFGRFVEGRKGRPSRFEWSSNQLEVGKAARAESASVSPMMGAGYPEISFEQLRTYQFPLRSGTDATLEVPVDLTDKEAERLAQFIKTLAVAVE